MKKTFLLIAGLFFTVLMQAQNFPQPQPGPSPAIKIGKPETFELKNGLKVLVVENHKLPRVSFSLSIDIAPYAEGDKKGVSDMLSALMGTGTTKTSKDAFNEEVDFLGANINLYSGGASAYALSKYAGRVLELMAEGALMPKFTQEEFDKQKEKMIEGLKSDEKSVPATASRVNSVLTFGKNHPNGEYLSEATLNNVTLQDVINNYNTYYVPGNAYLVIVGDVKVKEVKKMVEKLFGGWKKATAPSVSYPDPKDVQYTQINFVDMPNAVQSEVALINLSNLKMTDPDYFPTIIANQIFGGDFNSYINMNLREAHGWTYGARSDIGSGKYISSFEASTQVRNTVTDSTVVEILKELKRIRTEDVTEEMLNNVKAGYIGRFVMNIQKPQTIASFALRTRTQNLPADFYENYIKSIQAVTVADVKRAANKYFSYDNARLVIVGKGSDVLPALEKLKIPIFYFDKYGNPVDKPAPKKEIPAGVTAKTVLAKYIDAIGGQKAVSAVKSIAVSGSGSAQGMTLGYFKKATTAGKSLEGLSVMGQQMKKVFDGKTGYQSQGPQKMPMEADEIASMKYYAQPFPELTLANNPDVKLVGIENVNGSDAYVIQDGDTKLFYDMTSGLKVMESNEVDAGGQKMTVSSPFSDYRDVKGVKFPFKTAINVGIEIDITISEVKINEGVTDADFQ
ncbi:M16 family metallopeptidase [Flavobacterium sp.]|uniref:M16 family metallopeptidase n=1 Tax=Flavobacterium sp. TaxID=239 RepID=UPI003B9BE4E7